MDRDAVTCNFFHGCEEMAGGIDRRLHVYAMADALLREDYSIVREES